MKVLDQKIVQKAWGHEEWIINDKVYCGKKLVLKKGWQSSLHYHNTKDETFYILSGCVRLELDKTAYVLLPGEAVRIEPCHVHRFTGLKDSEIIEFSTYHDDDDVFRLEESRCVGRGSR